MNVEFSKHTSIKEREQIIELLNNMKLNGKKSKIKNITKTEKCKNKKGKQEKGTKKKLIGANTCQKNIMSIYKANIGSRLLKILKRDNYHCVKCRCKSNLNIHHLTYQNRGNELKHLHDLITLCRKCHEKNSQ